MLAELHLPPLPVPISHREDAPIYDDALADSGRITGIHIKPAEPPSTWIWGCAAARRRALDGLEREEWPGSFFNELCQNGVDLYAVPLSRAWLDIGTKESLERALASSER